MLVVKNIRVYTLDRDSLTVSWNYVNTTEDLSTYKVAILRSGAEEGGYSQVSQDINPEDTNEFEDSGVNLHSKYRDYYYRVKVTKTGTGDSFEFGSASSKDVLNGNNSGGVTLEAFPDLEATEAIRRFDLLLQEYIGRKVLILAHRSVGTRCTECWDKVKRRRSKSDCATCYGTGIVGGFYRPREAYAAKPPEHERNQLSSLFELQTNDVVMFFSSRPRLHPRDVVIDPDGRRFRVLNVQTAGKLWALTRQTVALRELSKDQVEYSIPITGWDVDTFTASPKRQFIRASDIDSYYAAAQAYGIDDA